MAIPIPNTPYMNAAPIGGDDMELHKGAIARDEEGVYGVITVDHPRSIARGPKKPVWIGVCIETGNIWTSRDPTYICKGEEVRSLIAHYKHYKY